MNTSTMLSEIANVNGTDSTIPSDVEELSLDTLSLVGGGCDPYNMF